MDQVFINCRLYNGPDSPIGQLGNRIHHEYMGLLKSMRLVERFGDEKELQKFQLDEAAFETRAAPTDVFREDISDSELPAEAIQQMNEKGETNGENSAPAESVHNSPGDE
jgi:hypothetical protein